MNSDPIIFALSNTKPEIVPDQALEAGARIVSTGRSDYANQVNNALVFPYMLRVLIDNRIKILLKICLLLYQMQFARLMKDDQLKEDSIIPKLNGSKASFYNYSGNKKATKFRI
jgi:malate dehydrogenase (oxaloacetate-decarboxylating)